MSITEGDRGQGAEGGTWWKASGRDGDWSGQLVRAGPPGGLYGAAVALGSPRGRVKSDLKDHWGWHSCRACWGHAHSFPPLLFILSLLVQSRCMPCSYLSWGIWTACNIPLPSLQSRSPPYSQSFFLSRQTAFIIFSFFFPSSPSVVPHGFWTVFFPIHSIYCTFWSYLLFQFLF